MTELILPSSLGEIIISKEAISRIAGMAAIECYGVVGMCSRSRIKDSFVELLGRENVSRGVEVNTEDNKIAIDLYIIVGYGTRLSEVAYNIMNKVKYVVESMIGVEVEKVNINVEGVRIS